MYIINLCLQETWHLDDNNDNNGRPKGGVAILYKKIIGNKVKLIISLNIRICGIIINLTPSFRCLLLLCDTHSITNVTDEYSSCIDYIEYMYNNGFICCGDFNTCLNKVNAQAQCLNDFVSRNNLAVY